MSSIPSTFSARLNASHLLHAAMSAAETDDDRAAVELLFALLKREHEGDSAVSKPELAKAIEHLAHDVLDDSMDLGYNIALACLARNFGIMGDHQWPEFEDGGISEIHRSGTKERIAKLEAQLKTAQIECDRAEGQSDKFAETIKSMCADKLRDATDAVHDGYKKVTTHEWHFDADGWSFVIEDILAGVLVVRREEDREDWYIELTSVDGVPTVTTHNGDDRQDDMKVEPMPASVPSAVEAYIRAHGVPS